MDEITDSSTRDTTADDGDKSPTLCVAPIRQRGSKSSRDDVFKDTSGEAEAQSPVSRAGHPTAKPTRELADVATPPKRASSSQRPLKDKAAVVAPPTPSNNDAFWANLQASLASSAPQAPGSKRSSSTGVGTGRN